MINKEILNKPLKILLGFDILISILILFCTAYQAITPYFGYSWTSQQVTSCTSAYLNAFFSNTKIILSISFSMIIFSIFSSISILFFLIYALVSFNREKEEWQQLQKTATREVVPDKPIYDSFFTYKKVILLYILFSLLAMANTVHCGSLFAFYSNKKRCDRSQTTEVLVIACISGCCLFFVLIQIGILLWLIKQIHIYLQDFRQLSTPLQVRKSFAGKAVEMTETPDKDGKYVLFKEIVDNNFHSSQKAEKNKSQLKNKSYLKYLESQMSPSRNGEEEKLKIQQHSFLRSGAKSVLQKSQVFIKESEGVRKKQKQVLLDVIRNKYVD